MSCINNSQSVRAALGCHISEHIYYYNDLSVEPVQTL